MICIIASHLLEKKIVINFRLEWLPHPVNGGSNDFNFFGNDKMLFGASKWIAENTAYLIPLELAEEIRNKVIEKENIYVMENFLEDRLQEYHPVLIS